LFILSLLVVSLSGCGEKFVQSGDTVKVHYTGTLSDGSVFDSSEGGDPLEFTAGAGQMIKGFDDAVIGMKVGEVKTVTIPADDAYGQHDDNLLIAFSKDELPEGVDPSVGDYIQLQQSNGTVQSYPVVEVTDTVIIVDVNHRLAGKDLTFEIELVDLTRNE
jgi:peptidylprolyl isomerase